MANKYWLAQRRLELKLTQGELAQKIGRPKTTIADWERKKKFPIRLEFVSKLAVALGIPITQILINEGFPIDYVFAKFKKGSPEHQILTIMKKTQLRKQKTIVRMVELLYEELGDFVLDTMDLEIDED